MISSTSAGSFVGQTVIESADVVIQAPTFEIELEMAGVFSELPRTNYDWLRLRRKGFARV